MQIRIYETYISADDVKKQICTADFGRWWDLLPSVIGL